MELQFCAPAIRWLSPNASPEIAPTTVPETSVVVSFPVRDGETGAIRRDAVRLPCQFTLSFDDEQALLKEKVEFKVTSDGRDVARHCVTLGECLPVLEDSHIEWRSSVSTAKRETEVHVTVPISTSRRPREAIAHALAYRDHAVSLAQKLALHKNAVAIGLLPPILGCFGGVLLTAPLWIPFTLFVGIIGFPLWVVVAVGTSLLIAISAVSSVITVKAIQSRRVKSALRELAQSPSGQYVLFANSGNTRVPSPTELAERIKIYVNEDPSRKLLASLLVDFIGNATFVVPGLGELADLFWAPASASLVGAMYSKSTPSAKYFAFLEEVLPFTDFIPTATLAWLKENLHKDDLKNLVASVKSD